MRQYTFIILLNSLLLTACYQDFDLETQRGESKIVINAIANGDTTVMADISRTWFFTDARPADDIKDLSVSLYVNGTLSEMMSYADGMYRSLVHPQAGDTLLVATEVDGEPVTAQVVMPPKTVIRHIEATKRMIRTWTEGEEFTYHITLPNTPEEKRFFFIRIRETDYVVALGDFDFSYDPAFQLTQERINRNLANLNIDGQFGLPFSNEGCKDSLLTISLKETVYPEDNNLALLHRDPMVFYDRHIDIYTLSEGYYRYLLGLFANDSDYSWQGGMTNLGLAEPMTIYSNISGGDGIFGGIQRDSTTIRLKPE